MADKLSDTARVLVGLDGGKEPEVVTALKTQMGEWVTVVEGLRPDGPARREIQTALTHAQEALKWAILAADKGA